MSDRIVRSALKVSSALRKLGQNPCGPHFNLSKSPSKRFLLSRLPIVYLVSLSSPSFIEWLFNLFKLFIITNNWMERKEKKSNIISFFFNNGWYPYSWAGLIPTGPRGSQVNYLWPQCVVHVWTLNLWVAFGANRHLNLHQH